MCALWTEEVQHPHLSLYCTIDHRTQVNFCVMGIFAAAMARDLPLAESWTPRLDEAMRKFYPHELAGAAGNYAMMAYRMSKEAEAKAKQGPSMF